MVQTASPIFKQAQAYLGQIRSPGGLSQLVLDDFEFNLLTRGPGNGADEVLSSRTEQPARADDQMSRTEGLDFPFPLELGETVVVDGGGRIGFLIRN